MIYIKRLNLCFIKIPKTGSVAMSHFLIDNFVKKEDVVSVTQFKDDFKMTMEHVVEGKDGLVGFRQNISRDHDFHSHMTAQESINHNLVPEDANFFGVVREPYSRMISMYVYNVKTGLGGYGPILPSVDHFRSLLENGVFQSSVYKRKLQSEFLLDKNSEYVCYDYIDDYSKHLAKKYKIKVKEPLYKLNTTPIDKTQLVDVFFTPELKKEVFKAYEKDFELYELTKQKKYD